MPRAQRLGGAEAADVAQAGELTACFAWVVVGDACKNTEGSGALVSSDLRLFMMRRVRFGVLRGPRGRLTCPNRKSIASNCDYFCRAFSSPPPSLT